MAIKAKRLGIGVGAFGVAGLLGLLALGALTAIFILALDTAMDAWLAALIVTVAYGAIAACWLWSESAGLKPGHPRTRASDGQHETGSRTSSKARRQAEADGDQEAAESKADDWTNAPRRRSRPISRPPARSSARPWARSPETDVKKQAKLRVNEAKAKATARKDETSRRRRQKGEVAGKGSEAARGPAQEGTRAGNAVRATGRRRAKQRRPARTRARRRDRRLCRGVGIGWLSDGARPIKSRRSINHRGHANGSRERRSRVEPVS